MVALEVKLENLMCRSNESVDQLCGLQKKMSEAAKRHMCLLKEAMEDTKDVSRK